MSQKFGGLPSLCAPTRKRGEEPREQPAPIHTRTRKLAGKGAPAQAAARQVSQKLLGAEAEKAPPRPRPLVPAATEKLKRPKNFAAASSRSIKLPRPNRLIAHHPAAALRSILLPTAANHAAAFCPILLPTTANHAAPPSPRRRCAIVTPEALYLSVLLAMSSFVISRKRSREGSDTAPYEGDFVRSTRLCLPPVEEMDVGESGGKDAAALAPPPPPPPPVPAPILPDDMLLEVFKRLPPPRDVIRCAAVCRRWRRLVAGWAGCLPALPRHFGFFRNYVPSPLPPFVPTAGVALDTGFIPVPPACGAILIDARRRLLLLRELGPGRPGDLMLHVCSPLEKTSTRVPPLSIGGHRMPMCALLPDEDSTAFRVVVVLFSDAANHFKVLVYSSTSSAWEAATGPVARALAVHPGPSVAVGEVVYKLQSEEKYIMTVDADKFTLSAVPLPDTGMLLYTGNHWIGKTGDGRLCFFAIREQLLLAQWVLEAPGKWVEKQSVNLRSLMRPELVGDLARTKLSAKMGDQLRGCKLVSFSAFCEGTGMLFFVMADCAVALDLESGRMERLWDNTDESRPLCDVYPCEMLQWPPALKDLGELDEAEGV